MKIIIAVDSYKECMSSIDVASNIEVGLRKSLKNVEIVKVPIADGGEGTVKALVSSTKGRMVNCVSQGPLMEMIDSTYGVLGDNKTVVIEMAATCSINMVSGIEKNPMNTTTYGMGTQVIDAMNKGYRKFIIGLGGACVSEGGIGMFQALGFTFKDSEGNILENGQGGKQLIQIKSIDRTNVDSRLQECEFTIASDVKNPLYGLNGAAYVYAPQKGATAEMVEELDLGLRNYADVVKNTFGIDISEIHGSGAAGGIGGGLIAFLNGKMKSGIDIVLEVNEFEDLLKSTDLVITGEGKMDKQTCFGKVPYGVSQVSSKHGVPVIAICGRVEIDAHEIKKMEIQRAYEVSPKSIPLEIAIADCERNLKQTASHIGEIIQNSINDRKIEEER